MKKLIVAVLAMIVLVGCSAEKDKTEKKNKNVCDIECEVADMSEYETMKESDHVFKLASFKQSNEMLKDEKFTGIIYYGYPACPWCVEAVPIMNEVAKKYDLTIYYVNKKSQENIDNPEGEKEATKILDKAYGLDKDDEDKPRLFVPEVVVVKDGEIVAHHMGTLDNHDATERKMNEDEIRILKKIYDNMFIKISE